jgi:hypothetical protein
MVFMFTSTITLYPHALLNITIAVGNPFAMYLPRGEIRWVRGEEPEVSMGILLEDVEGTDHDKWVNDFTHVFVA